MADNAISLDSQLIGRGLDTTAPQDTYVDFANNLVKNQQNQSAQEAAIAKAQELAKQSQLDTAGQQEAADAGYNKDLVGTMTPEAAVLYVKSALAAKGITNADAQVDAWGAQLKKDGALVPREAVEAFASRFAHAGTRQGQRTKLTTDMDLPVPKGKSATDLGLEDMTDGSGKSVDDNAVSDGTFKAHVPSDGMYQVIEDQESGHPVSYNPGGTDVADKSLALSEKDAQFWENQWKSRIANKLDPYMTSSRTAIGVALQSLNRCVRALETLSKPPVTKQDLQQVIIEIGNIYKGGSPDQAQVLATTYKSLYGDFMDWAQSKIGQTEDAVPNDILNHIVMRIRDLEDNSRNVVMSAIAAAEALNKTVISHFPDEWEDFKAVINKALTDAYNPQPNGMPGATPAPMAPTPSANPHMDAIAGVLGLKKKVPQGK